MVRKTYKYEDDLPVASGADVWPVLAHMEVFFAERIRTWGDGLFVQSTSLDDEAGSADVTTLEDARRVSETNVRQVLMTFAEDHNRVRRLRREDGTVMTLAEWNHLHSRQVALQFSDFGPTLTLYVEGPDEAEVIGLGRFASAELKKRASPAPPAMRSRRDRMVERGRVLLAHPWVVTVVGGALAGLIVLAVTLAVT